MGSAVTDMSSPPEPTEQDAPWAFERRVALGWGPRDMAFMPALLAFLASGIGIFMAHDSAMERVPFWSNPAVWFGVIHLGFCFAAAAWMRWGRLTWTAPQMGLATQCLLSLPYMLHFSSLWGVCFYGTAPMWARTGIFLTSVAWHGWWIAHVVQKSRAIWADDSLRQRVWVRYEPTFVYRRSGAKAAMDRVKLRMHPSTGVVVGIFLLIIPLMWWRAELSAYFGVPFVHIFMALLGGPTGIIGLTAALAAFMLMMYYPAKLLAETGKPVLVDMVTPANAPIPETAARSA